jgi:hypothetical protein
VISAVVRLLSSILHPTQQRCTHERTLQAYRRQLPEVLDLV